jgi:uncharacterized protein YdcH (DUF465 family)
VTQAAHDEIRRLQRLHQGAELQLALLTKHRRATPAQQQEIRELKKRRLQLKDRIAWFEAILREHEPLTAQ